MIKCLNQNLPADVQEFLVRNASRRRECQRVIRLDLGESGESSFTDLLGLGSSPGQLGHGDERLCFVARYVHWTDAA